MDLYGQRRYLDLMAEYAGRLEALRRTAADAAEVYQSIVVALREDGETPELLTQATRTGDIARRALDLLVEERRIGLARSEAALGVDDPPAYAAIQRFHQHLLAPYRHLAAHAITAWPSAPFPVTDYASRLAALDALDMAGHAGAALAQEVVAHVERRALDDRGKGHCAPRSSSRGATRKVTSSGRRARGRAKRAGKRA